MSGRKKYQFEDIKRVQNLLGLDFSEVDDDEFLMGLNVELEHGTVDPETDVTGDDDVLTAKIALAHLREFPDYYTRVEKLENEAEKFWKTQEE